MDQEIEKRRADWLGNVGLKGVVEGAFEIEAEFGRLCPRLGGKSLEDQNDALQTIATISKRISTCIRHMADLEVDGSFGFKKAFGLDPYDNETLVTCMSLLAAARLEPKVARELYTVGEFSTFGARRDPVTSLGIRSFFREDGILHRFVVLQVGRGSVNLDEYAVRIRESVFNTIVGLKSGDRTELIAEAEGILLGRTRR
jgi:hypothetical protein